MGKKVVNAMYVNVGNVNHSVEREKQNVHVFQNPDEGMSNVWIYIHLYIYSIYVWIYIHTYA